MAQPYAHNNNFQENTHTHITYNRQVTTPVKVDNPQQVHCPTDRQNIIIIDLMSRMSLRNTE